MKSLSIYCILLAVCRIVRNYPEIGNGIGMKLNDNNSITKKTLSVDWYTISGNFNHRWGNDSEILCVIYKLYFTRNSHNKTHILVSALWIQIQHTNTSNISILFVYNSGIYNSNEFQAVSVSWAVEHNKVIYTHMIMYITIYTLSHNIQHLNGLCLNKHLLLFRIYTVSVRLDHKYWIMLTLE